MLKKIYRSSQDRVIAGLCGGLGEYFNSDPKLFRWLFISFALCGLGFVTYIIGWIMIPKRPAP